jgi:hypothetical protein
MAAPDNMPAMDDGMGDMDMSDMDMSSDGLPDNLDTNLTQMTDAGHFQATLRSELDPVEINVLHNWVLHVETMDGEPVENAAILISGGMPQHGHGFPTNPAVTEYLGDGDYLVEGMRFQMPGWWQMTFAIALEDAVETVQFNVVLP